MAQIFFVRHFALLFKESNTKPMDGGGGYRRHQQVFAAVKSVPGVHNPHRARIHKLANAYVVELDIEVAGDLSVAGAQELGLAVEEQIKATQDNVYDVMIHVEPRSNVEQHERFGLSRKDV